MIGNLLFSLEALALTLLLGLGTWYIYRGRHSPTLDPSSLVAYDMRQGG